MVFSQGGYFSIPDQISVLKLSVTTSWQEITNQIKQVLDAKTQFCSVGKLEEERDIVWPSSDNHMFANKLGG